MALEVGGLVPDLPLVTPAGERTGLHAFRGEATLLIFLRHLG